MEALKTKGVAREGVLSIPVPKEFDGKELEVILLSLEKGEDRSVVPESVKQDGDRESRLLSIIGKAAFPDFPTSKYDVYEQ